MIKHKNYSVVLHFINAFIKLKALGLQPSKEALTSYGNTATAMGKSLEARIEAVADASTGEFERQKLKTVRIWYPCQKSQKILG